MLGDAERKTSQPLFAGVDLSHLKFNGNSIAAAQQVEKCSSAAQRALKAIASRTDR